MLMTKPRISQELNISILSSYSHEMTGMSSDDDVIEVMTGASSGTKRIKTT